MALLRLLPALASVSKVTHLFARSTVQYSALRLAAYDMKLATIEFSLPMKKKVKFVQQAFDKNLLVFMKSWKLRVEVSEKLRISPLDALSALELHRLQDILQSGWQDEIQVQNLDGQGLSKNVWVTPAEQ